MFTSRIQCFLYSLTGFTSTEKHDVLKEFAEDVSFLNEIKKEYLYELGMTFFHGFSGHNFIIEKSYSRALKCLEKAADKQYPGAILQLGIMYHCGYGVQQDIRRCEEIFNDAASKDVGILGRIAVLYHTHKDIQDFTKAFEWYNRLSQLICENSFEDDDKDLIMSRDLHKIGLGLLYEYGDVVEQDYDMAIEYYEELADGESPAGFYFLGLIFYYGKGVPTDYKKALQNFKKVVDANEVEYCFPIIYDRNDSDRSKSGSNRVYCEIDGFSLRGEAYYQMAVMYRNGLGVPQDKEEARVSFLYALDYGCERADYELDKY